MSATNRQPREGEVHGVSYWFLTDEEFRQAIADDNFVEYEEVYPGRFYGTLKSEVERRCREGHNVVLDIDVKGGVNVKRMYGERALALFIEPPSIDALRVRLEGRGTESPEAISQRLGKAEYELLFAPSYDIRIVNDDLDKAVADTEKAIKQFVGA